uniref:CEP170_C domain-containing protein n=1 Tax=Panagrellus redivivus TaxID=6233 RepID=A0A7E4VFK3_PANRE
MTSESHLTEDAYWRGNTEGKIARITEDVRQLGNEIRSLRSVTSVLRNDVTNSVQRIRALEAVRYHEPKSLPGGKRSAPSGRSSGTSKTKKRSGPSGKPFDEALKVAATLESALTKVDRRSLTKRDPDRRRPKQVIQHT